MDADALTLLGLGLAVLGAALLPMLLARQPISFPLVYLVLGAAAFSLPLDLPVADPLAHPELVERATELVVIVSLTGAGLKLDRRPGWRRWRLTRRLIFVAMPLTIAAVALSGWWLVGLAPASALLLGAALAPTDPVLAEEVQVGPPGGPAEDEDDVRFAVTSEAGVNDAAAFPFVNAAIAMAAAGGAGVQTWIGGWVLEDLLAKIAIGLVVGVLAGRAFGHVLFRLPRTRGVAESTEGFVALAITLVVYGAAEVLHGYGFVAVFVAALVVRAVERDHEYHEVLHASAEGVERMVSGALLVLLGGAVVDGVLAPIGWPEAAVIALLVLVVRPVAARASLVGTSTPRIEQWAIAYFGIRGMGSLYYLAHATVEQPFEQLEQLWAIVVGAVVASVILHGITAAPIVARLDARR